MASLAPPRSTPVTIELEARPGLPKCPVAALRSYLELRGASHAQDALFIGDSRRPITGRQLNHALQQAASITGHDVSRLSGYCLRIGGASHGATIGMTEVQFSEAERWSS